MEAAYKIVNVKSKTSHFLYHKVTAMQNVLLWTETVKESGETTH